MWGVEVVRTFVTGKGLSGGVITKNIVWYPIINMCEYDPDAALVAIHRPKVSISSALHRFECEIREESVDVNGLCYRL